ncbi:partitioning defective 3 homolog isoform X1 [Argonauta hians]
MKVTVCFDNVKVIVPCGDGYLPVKELIEKAVVRYKKATGKSDSWVSVQSLKTSTDEGILDPDDFLNDVVDDREQLIAIYDESHLNHVFNNGDGASASSVGTSSPDIFQNNNGLSNSNNEDFQASGQTDNGVIVTLEDVLSGPTLHVRRGSEPALANLGEDEASTSFVTQPEASPRHKRWSTFGNEREFQASTPNEENGDSHSEPEKCLQPRWNSTGHNKNKYFATHFTRNYCRQSLGAQPDMLKWVEAQERYEEKLKDIHDGREDSAANDGKYKNNDIAEKELEITVILKNDGQPLGVHVLPDYDDDERETGLVVQSIEPGSKISCDGRLKADDRIIEINGVNIIGISFENAQNIFRDAMKTEEIQLKVLKSNPPPLPKKPPPLLPKPTVRNQKPSTKSKPPKSPSTESSPIVKPRETAADNNNNNTSEQAAAATVPESNLPGSHRVIQSSPLPPPPQLHLDLDKDGDRPIGEDEAVLELGEEEEEEVSPSSPSKKVPPAVPARHPTTALSTKDKSAFSASTNTRKIGKKLLIQLKKGSNGLGFSITTRDNPTGGVNPIYIKSILPQGAAVEDGRLKAGDRLLEVDGIEMTGKNQVEAVTILRKIKTGCDVELLVSRQELDKPPVKPPRENVEKKNSSQSASPLVVDGGDDNDDDVKASSPIPNSQNHEFLVLDIVLNESGSAGLGVSVKGNTNPSATGINRDLGIFVKGIISGGAASKDGRLAVNDQLLEINGHSLLGLTNQDAMETLRKTMRSIDPINGKISLVVARSVGDVLPSSSLSQSVVEEFNSKQKDSFSEELESIERGNVDNAMNQQNNISQHSLRARNFENGKNLNAGINNGECSIVEGSRPLPAQLERLRVGRGQEGLHNDSYNRAVHSRGVSSPEGFHNDSYHRAVHSSFEESYLDNRRISPMSESKNSNSSSGSKRSTKGAKGLQSLTVNQHAILVDDESFDHGDNYPPVFVGEPPHSNPLPHYIEKDFEDRRDQNPPSRLPHQNSPHLPHPHLPPPHDYHPNQYRHPSDNSDSWTDNFDSGEFSPMSPDSDLNYAFQREAFGRQSMSEKRRGHLDARQTEFYQIAKTGRKVPDEALCRRVASFHYPTGGKQGTLVRAGSMESLIGNKSNQKNTLHDNLSTRGSHPNMGLRKRSCSMESLPTPDTMFENASPPFWVADRINRAHMCNESFRAAVDRSYEVPHLSQNMETLEEENSDSGSIVGHNYAPHPLYASVPPTEVPAVKENSQPKPTKKKERDNRKSGGFLKGIFRFNKGNKEDKGSKDHSNEAGNKQKHEKPPPEILEMDKNWKIPPGDQPKFLDHPRSPQVQTKSQPHKPRAIYPKEYRAMDGYNGMVNNNNNNSRNDKIQQLREDHQRKHQERQGRYPHEEKEELYEKHLQDIERGKMGNYNSPPYQEVEYAIVNKNRSSGARTLQHERVPVQHNYGGHPPYNYIPEPINEESFYETNYSEIPPKVPPPYSRAIQHSWHDDVYNAAPPWPANKHNKDDVHRMTNSSHSDNMQANQKHWMHPHSGGQSAPPTWQHKIHVESPIPLDGHYNYIEEDSNSFQERTFVTIQSGKRTPTQTANV